MLCIDPENEDTSFSAFNYCLDLLRKDEDELFILTVATPVNVGILPFVDYTALNTANEDKRKQLKELLLKYGRYCREHNLNATMLLGHGTPKTVINNEVKEREIDVVVVGRRSMSGFKRLFLGSTSKSLVEDCPCTVLVAKEFPEPERIKETTLQNQKPVEAN